MGVQKHAKIRLGNSHEALDAVRDEKFILDPAPNRPCRNFQKIGDLRDRVELAGSRPRVDTDWLISLGHRSTLSEHAHANAKAIAPGEPGIDIRVRF